MTYLSHKASFHSIEWIAPSNPGIKHLVLDEARSLFFIHVPKTGGTAVEGAHGFGVHEREGRKIIRLRHGSFREMKKRVEAHDLPMPDLLLGIIRNTYFRIQSKYKHLFRDRFTPSDLSPDDFTFDMYLEHIAEFSQVKASTLKRKEPIGKTAQVTRSRTSGIL